MSESKRFTPPWRLDAPEGFRWTNSDVQFERTDGWLSGMLWGLFLGAAIVGICVVVFG